MKLNNFELAILILVMISPFNLVFQYFLNFSLLYAFLGFCYFYVFCFFYFSSVNGKTKSKVLFLAFWYVSLIFSLILGCIHNGISDSSISILFYILFPLLIFTIIFINGPKLNVEREIVLLNTFLALIIGCIGWYQIYYDPTLLGMYTNSEFSSFEFWSVKRAASILGSIQVYATYMSFTMLSLYLFKPFNNDAYNNASLFIIFILGLASGSQTFFILGLLLLILNFKSKIVYILPLFLILIFSNLDIISNITAVERVINLLTGGASYIGERNSGRFDIWLDTINNTNFFYGNGLGSASLGVSDKLRYNSESYFLNMYYETGFLLPLSFSLLLFYIFSTLRFKVAILFAVFYFSNFITVHTMFSVFLFFPWILVVLIYSRFKKERL